jgi:competence protein ComEA
MVLSCWSSRWANEILEPFSFVRGWNPRSLFIYSGTKHPVGYIFEGNPPLRRSVITSDKSSRFWLLAAFLLILIIVVSSVLIWIRRDQGIPITISPPEPTQFSGQVLVDGAVEEPGIYPLKTGDSLESILQASGGTSSDADLSRIRLYVPSVEEIQETQKVDINKAEAWMLEALPDIGAVRAQAILTYRLQNGLFANIAELTNVPGISAGTLEKIRNLITISN